MQVDEKPKNEESEPVIDESGTNSIYKSSKLTFFVL